MLSQFKNISFFLKCLFLKLEHIFSFCIKGVCIVLELRKKGIYSGLTHSEIKNTGKTGKSRNNCGLWQILTFINGSKMPV